MGTVIRGFYDSQMLQLARDYLSDGSFSGDYLFYRSGDYQCTLLIGNIDFDNMTYENCRDVRFGRHPATGGEGYYTCNLESVAASGTLSNPDGVVVYGSEIGLPHLTERSELHAEVGTLLGVAVLTVLLLVLRIFDNVQRR